MPKHARVVLLAAFAVSCSVDLAPPADVVITCQGNEECPAAYRCSSQLGRCVPGGQEDVPPRVLNLTAVVTRGAGTAVEAATVGSTVRVTFQVDEELLEAPVVTLTWPDSDDGRSRQGTATATSTGYEMVTTIADTDPAGAVSISVIAIDLASNVGNAELPRQFTVDKTQFLLSSVSLRPRSPVPTELTAIGVDVTAARNEAPGDPEVEAQIIFSKPPRATPTVILEGPGGDIVGVVSALASTSYSVTFEVGDDIATAPNGDVFDLSITALDASGSSWTLAPSVALPTIVIDTEPPVMPTSLRFLRAPWGGGDALPERTFAVEGTTPGALVGVASSGDLDRLFVHDVEGAARARLGFASLAASGALPGNRLLLSTADRLEVFAILVDAAGNEGPALRVTDGRWIATFKGRTTGNDFLNPHRLTAVSEPGSALSDGLATETGTADLARVVLADGDSYTHSVGSGLWRYRRLGSPPAQAAGGAVYVPSTDKVLLVGGSSDDSVFPNMWDWDGRDWREIDLIGTLWPSENFGPALAHDSARDRTVYHGGTATSDPLQRTWEYDGTTWFDVTPTTPGPAAVFAPMVFDSVNGVSVLYGALEDPVAGVCAGGGAPEPLVAKCLSTTTWLWDGSTWDGVPCTNGNCPTARAFTSMAFDPESARVVLFGGTTSLAGGTNLGDLWEWDTATRTWNEVTPASGLTASPRRSPVMSYMGGFGGVVIWGGCEAGEFFDCAPDADGSDNVDDLLVWQGSAATPHFIAVSVGIPPSLPGPLVSRGVAQATYLPARDRMFVFGGVRQLNATPIADCSPTYDRACDGVDPGEKNSGGPLERCVCAFETGWMLQATNTTPGSEAGEWRQVAAPSFVHSPTTAFAMTYSPTHRRTYIFGGRTEGDDDCDDDADNDSSKECHSMWTWNGISVRPENVVGSSNIVDATSCGTFDDPAPCGQSERASTLLPLRHDIAFFDQPEAFNGVAYNRGLWLYHGGGGPPYFTPPPSEATNAQAPPDTQAYAIATSVTGVTPGVDETVYLFGGYVGSATCAVLNSRYGVSGGTQSYGTSSGSGCLSRALWRWNQGVWTLFLPATGNDAWPSPRAKVSMVEIGSGRLLLYGGCNVMNNTECSAAAATPVNGDTWVLTPGPTWTCASGTSPTCPAPTAGDPGPLNGSRLAWDPESSRVFMFGGSSQADGPGPNDVYSWRENDPPVVPVRGTWSTVAVDGVKPLTRKRHGLVYDTDRKVLIVAGEGRVGEIWELGFDRGNRPVMVFDFALRAAGLSEVPGVERASDVVERMRFVADVTAAGFAGPDPVDGVFVQMWSSPLARWFDIGQSFEPGGPFAGTCVFDTDPVRSGRQVVCTLTEDEARAMVFAGDEHVYVRIAPGGGVGLDGEESVLSLDAVRLEVEYALP